MCNGLVAGLMTGPVAGFMAMLVAGLSGPISTLMPKLALLVLRAEIIPWAPSFSPTSYSDDQAKCLSTMMRDFLPCGVG